MKYTISQTTLKNATSAARVIVYSSKKTLKKDIAFDSDLTTFIDTIIDSKQLDDTKENMHVFSKVINLSLVTYYFLSAHPKQPRKGIRYVFGELSRHLKKHAYPQVDIFFCMPYKPTMLCQSVEGLGLGCYSYTTYKSDSFNGAATPKSASTIHFAVKATKENKEALKRGEILASSQNIARDLANCPSNDLTPADFISYAYHQFEDTSVDITCFEKSDLEDMNMGALLAVAKGSNNAPYLLQLHLNKSSKKKPIVLVGKGVTFDSGGISIKPSKSMGQMKADMSGAAAVLASMKGLHDLGESRPVIALIPLVENMPSSTAYKPGDVLTAKNKKTIEVINTDAEGRLILADSLCYAVEQKPGLIIDIATLTGACLVALGNVANGICSNRSAVATAFKSHEHITGEPAWELPIYPEFLDYLKSDVADLINCAENRLAGTATAAVFLQQFVDDIPWLHIDMASTMHYGKSSGHIVKGMSGAGTRSLIEFVQQVDLKKLID